MQNRLGRVYFHSMRQLIRRHTISVRHALEGLIWAFKSQPNFQIHAVLSTITIAAGLYFRITRTEFLILIFTILLGMAGELINTALESITDLVTTEWRESAKRAKDVSAGMMLFIAFGAIIVAAIIFVPYIWERLFSL